MIPTIFYYFSIEPTLSFKEGIFMVNETDKYFEFPIIRQGKLNYLNI